MGARHSKVAEVTKFLNSLECERLILAGDILDAWQLKKENRNWTVQDSAFFSVVMKMMEDHGTEVIYLTGNHDDFLDGVVPGKLFNISILSSYKFTSGDHNVIVIHGHAFDIVSMRFRWLAKLGDVAYNQLIKVNKIWNRDREKTGQEKYSFSQVLKNGVKNAVNLISGFEGDLADYAKANKCDIVICGHIHRPADKELKGGVRYLNSGDWVESLTGLVEDFSGNWSLLKYTDLFPAD